MPPSFPAREAAARRLFRASVCLAIAVVVIKACYLGAPGWHAGTTGQSYVAAVAAITYIDVVFVAGAWLIARLLLGIVGRWRPAAHAIAFTFVILAAFSCLYVVANVVMLESLGGFLTYQLLALVGDVHMVRSSVAAYLTTRVVGGLVGVPLVYVAIVWISGWVERAARSASRDPGGRTAEVVTGARVACAASIAVWVGLGVHAYSTEWKTRQDRAIAESPQWVFISSWWRAVNGPTMGLTDRFEPEDLDDFLPLGGRPPAPSPRRASLARSTRPQRPLNVILLVLESVAARWTSLHGAYETTPTLASEAAHALVFDNFYAHIGRSSNSLAAMLLSAYPKLDFKDITDEYPRLAGTSLASMFEERGYRTAFITPSDLSWAGWTTFLEGRGFETVSDYRQLACPSLLSSWGVEDRCMFDGLIREMTRDPGRPFFIMGWTQQTHHPYEPSPGAPLLDLVREPSPDAYELNRYLNILRELDHQLGRLFDVIRGARLDENTMVVIVGDHGQAFGYPHEGDYMQGRTVYQEDVHVPLMLWYPRLKAAGTRSPAIGGHVDLAPTIAKIAGLSGALDWQGRSLVEAGHPPRAYFYVAEDRFKLGVRESNWKYIYDLREATEELYDLDRDPTEQHNLAGDEPQRSARLRQHLAAWTEANRRQYQLVQ